MREILRFSVDPTEEEVVVAVGNVFNSFEPFESSGIVEFLADFLSQGQQGNVEASIQGVLLPVTPLVSLDVLLRPVPSILTLHGVFLAIDFQNSHGMTTTSTSSPLNDLI